MKGSSFNFYNPFDAITRMISHFSTLYHNREMYMLKISILSDIMFVVNVPSNNNE